MKTPLIAARVDPALIAAIRTRYRFAPGDSDAVIVRFALAITGAHPDPIGAARRPIGAPRTRDRGTDGGGVAP